MLQDQTLKVKNGGKKIVIALLSAMLAVCIGFAIGTFASSSFRKAEAASTTVSKYYPNIGDSWTYVNCAVSDTTSALTFTKNSGATYFYAYKSTKLVAGTSNKWTLTVSSTFTRTSAWSGSGDVNIGLFINYVSDTQYAAVWFKVTGSTGSCSEIVIDNKNGDSHDYTSLWQSAFTPFPIGTDKNVKIVFTCTGAMAIGASNVSGSVEVWYQGELKGSGNLKNVYVAGLGTATSGNVKPGVFLIGSPDAYDFKFTNPSVMTGAVDANYLDKPIANEVNGTTGGKYRTVANDDGSHRLIFPGTGSSATYDPGYTMCTATSWTVNATATGAAAASNGKKTALVVYRSSVIPSGKAYYPSVLLDVRWTSASTASVAITTFDGSASGGYTDIIISNVNGLSLTSGLALKAEVVLSSSTHVVRGYIGGKLVVAGSVGNFIYSRYGTNGATVHGFGVATYGVNTEFTSVSSTASAATVYMAAVFYQDNTGSTTPTLTVSGGTGGASSLTATGQYGGVTASSTSAVTITVTSSKTSNIQIVIDTSSSAPTPSTYAATANGTTTYSWTPTSSNTTSLATIYVHIIEVHTLTIARASERNKLTNATNITLSKTAAGTLGSTSLAATASTTWVSPYSTSAVTLTLTKADASYNYYVATNTSTTAPSTSNAIQNSTTFNWTPTADGNCYIFVWQVFTVTLEKNGATSISATTQYKLHSVNLTLATITRTSGTVIGWNTSSSATTSEIASGGSYTSNATATYYAVTYVTYTGTFYSTSTSSSQFTKTVNVYNTNTSGTLAAATAPTTQSGWTTLGWRDDTTAGAKEYDSTASITVTGNTSFYAVYSRTVKVTYDGNGNTSGSMSADSSTQYRNVVTNEEKTITLSSNEFVKTGYTFGSWNSQADGNGSTITSPVSFTSKASTDTTNNVCEVVAYVKWTINSYTLTVTYKAANVTNATNVTVSSTTGGTVTGSPMTAVNGTVTVTSNYSTTALTITFTKANGSYTYYLNTANSSSGRTATSKTYSWTPNDNGSVDVYVWQSYAVTYNKNGATSIGATSDTKIHGETLTLPSITRTGGTVVGWNASASATTGANTYTSNAAADLNAITYVTYTATFYAGESNAKQGEESVNVYNTATSGNVTTLTPTAISGWTAEGWKEGTSAGAATVGKATSVSISGDKTYYGAYSRTVSIVHHGNGNDGGSTANKEGTQYRNGATYSSVVLTPNSNGFTKTGYTFNNWYTATSGGSTVSSVTFDGSTNTSGSYDVYAQWSADERTLTITFVTGDWTHATALNLSATSGTLGAESISLADVSNTTLTTGYSDTPIRLTASSANGSYKYYVSTSGIIGATTPASATYDWTPTTNRSVSLYVLEVCSFNYGLNGEDCGVSTLYVGHDDKIDTFLTTSSFNAVKIEASATSKTSLFWFVNDEIVAIDGSYTVSGEDVVANAVALGFESPTIGIRATSTLNGLRYVNAMEGTDYSYLLDISRTAGVSLSLEQETLIINTSSVPVGGLTKAAFEDATGAVKAKITNYTRNGWANGTESEIRSSGEDYEFAATVVDFIPTYYTTSFTGRSVCTITYEVSGEETSIDVYSDAIASTVHKQAYIAYNDRNATQTGKYQFVTVDGNYSPYTSAMLEIIKRYIDRIVTVEISGSTISATNPYTSIVANDYYTSHAWYEAEFDTDGKSIVITPADGTFNPTNVYSVVTVVSGTTTKVVNYQKSNGRLVVNPSSNFSSVNVTEQKLTVVAK